MAITLSQYYNEYAISQGYNSWNHYCASIPESHRDSIKKVLKRYFNSKLKNTERQKEWRAKQKEKLNVPKKT